MTEAVLLHGLVLGTFIVAPRATSRLLLRPSKGYDTAHAVALCVLVVSAALDLPQAAVIWPLFCAFGVVLHLRDEGRRVFSLLGVARGIPFVFSLVSATWFVAARNDLQLLGYPPSWSFYAALHGSVLGWLVIGCTAHLASRSTTRGLYLWSCLVSLPLFLFVALGIDGVAHLKRIGAVGLSLLIPLVIGRFALELRRRSRAAFRLAVASVVAAVGTMVLALFNEFWSGFPRILLGMPTMVLLHGCVNALVVAPGYALAVALDGEGGSRGGRAE
jgi:hypothetical protein